MSHKGANRKMSPFVRELSKTTILNRVDVVKFVEPTIVGVPAYEGETPSLSRAGMR